MDIMSEAESHQRVVVIMDASIDDSVKVIEGVLQGFKLKPGDNLTVLPVLLQVNSPMGYRIKVEGANQIIIKDAVSKMETEYKNKEEIMDISHKCEKDKIGFHLTVLGAKMAAIEEAKMRGATTVVLDKEMKRDKKFFMDGLSCRICRIKSNNSIEELRGPKGIGSSKPPTESSMKSSNEGNTNDYFKYDDMIPGSPPKGKHSHHKGSSQGNTEARPSTASKGTTHIFDDDTINKEGERTGEQSSHPFVDSRERDLKGGKQEHHPNDNDWRGQLQTDEVFINSICSKCDNRRPKVGWKKEFTYQELHVATKGFSDKNYLSEGGFGSVFRGELTNGLTVAVKQLKNASFQGDKEFKAEVHFLSRARHENLVMLLGSCSEGSKRLLVYEYVCNGSLDRQLSKHTSKPLSWEVRMKIAMGAAKGLQYLHQNNIIHRDIRPNNILITHDHETLLGDFGLARTQQEGHSSETGVVGSIGYLAPEYAECGKVSTKADVYAFGVILLQLITGRKTNDKSLEGKSLVGWARPLLKDRNYPGLIDPRIEDSHDVHQLFWMVQVATRCLAKDPYKRLTMDKVMEVLELLKNSDAICNMKDFCPAHSDSSPGSNLESPETKKESDDDDQANDGIKTKLGYSLGDYDHMKERLSPSFSTQSTSSGNSSIAVMSE
ncbi:hypothetical protein UlMin_024959 [Ulmus minor]